MFKTALKLFETLNLETRTKINASLLTLVDQVLIETTGQNVSDVLDAVKRIGLTSDLHLLHKYIICHIGWDIN